MMRIIRLLVGLGFGLYFLTYATEDGGRFYLTWDHWIPGLLLIFGAIVRVHPIPQTVREYHFRFGWPIAVLVLLVGGHWLAALIVALTWLVERNRIQREALVEEFMD